MTNKIVVKASFPSVEKKPMEEEVEKDTIEPVVADEPCKSGEITIYNFLLPFDVNQCLYIEVDITAEIVYTSHSTQTVCVGVVTPYY